MLQLLLVLKVNSELVARFASHIRLALFAIVPILLCFLARKSLVVLLDATTVEVDLQIDTREVVKRDRKIVRCT